MTPLKPLNLTFAFHFLSKKLTELWSSYIASSKLIEFEKVGFFPIGERRWVSRQYVKQT